MELTDSPAQASFRTELRAWLAANPVPGDETGARQDGMPEAESVRRFSAALHTAGLAGVTWPVEHGGRGFPPTFESVFFEEIMRAERGDHLGVIGLGMVGPALIAFGTEEQKNHYLPRILSGDMLFCQGFSEPEAGSDLASVRTTAAVSGDHVVVNGHKVWSTAAAEADHCLLLARTDAHVSGHRGLSCLLVDLRAPGVEVRPLRQLSGEARFGELTFADVRVPLDAVLGVLGAGWRVAMTTLSHERGTFGVRLAAMLARDFDHLVALAHQLDRDQDPLVRDRMAALWVEVAGLRWVAHRMMSELALGGALGPESSIVKLRWADADQRRTELAVELLGDTGILTGDDGAWRGYWTRQQLRSRGSSLEGGTSDVLRDIVAQHVLGLPRTR